MKHILYSTMIAGFLLAGNVVYAQANLAAENNSGDLEQAPAEVLESTSGGGVSTPYNGNPAGASSANDHRQQGGGHVTVQDILGVDNNSPAQTVNNNVNLTGTPSTVGGSGSVPVNSAVPQGGGSGTSAAPALSISIFPNPTTDGVNVVTEGEIIFGVVEVIDLTGKTVKKTNAPSGNDGNSSNMYISLSELKSGMYLLRFQTDKNIYVKRIQVK